MNKKPRESFAKTEIRTDLPNLIETQKVSYDVFLQRDVSPDKRIDTGLQAVFNEVFPIRDFSEVNSLEFVSYTLGTPKYTLQECVARGVTYQVSLTARIMLVLRETDPDADEPHVVDIRESDVYLGEVPLMTENGSFIVNGSERVIVSQLHRSPGVIFLEKSLPTGRRTPTAQIIPYRGAWVEFEIDTKDQIYVRIDKRRKLPATVLLRALGWASDADILKLYAKTERLVLDGWQVTHVEVPAIRVKAGDLLDAAEFRQANKDYPDLDTEKYYRVTLVPDDGCPLEIGQLISEKERTSLRRKWKGFETELLRRVVDTHDSGCEFTLGQVLTNSEYEAALDRYGKEVFTAEQMLSEDAQDRVCAEDVIHQETGEVLLTANTLLTETELERLKEAGVEALTVLDTEDCQHIRFLRNTLERDRQADYEAQYSLQDAALLTIFRTLRPGDTTNIENARKHLTWLLFDSHRYDLGVVGRYKLNRKFHGIPVYGEPPEETVRTLRPEDIAATVDRLLKVHNGLAPKDDLDHLGNRRVRVIGELLENQFRMGLFQIRRTTRERLSTNNDVAKVVPSSLVNPKPLMMALREFFGSNQLSQFMQQINPLDELTHKRRISAIGPGGLHRDRATAAVRDVHRTHYGRVCPLETPEGPSIGLIVSLACYGRINPYGFIETPYRKVENGSVSKQVEYLTADSEDTAYIAAKTASAIAHHHDERDRVTTERDAPETTNGGADASGQLLPVRSGEDVLSLPMEKVDYIGVSPQQIVGISAALVPFLEHEDANRALMGANHQRQAVPLVRPEAPLVGTGMEEPAARYSGALITAKRAGTVTSVSADEILIYTGEALHHDEGENTFSEMGYDVYKLQTFKRSNSGTCIHQRPIVAVGDKVEAEQVIVDGTSTESGELALGRNILCAYMPWGGHNYEDSILISETLITEDTFTSIHIEEFEVEARETKVGPEEITRDIPNVSEQRLSQLDEEGIIRVGSVVKAGSILVGKITPKGESEYGPEEKLLRAIFGEKVKEVRDASTYVRPGVEGVVIDVKVFSRKPDGAQRRGNWMQDDSGLSMADGLRYESKRKEIEENWRQQTASIRRRKVEEIRNALIGAELVDPLYAVNVPEPFANAGDSLTAEVLDTYMSGFTADEYWTVTEDAAAEAFTAEPHYRVTSVPEPVPTLATRTPENADATISDEDEDFEAVGISSVASSEIVSAVEAYLSEVCKPILGDRQLHLQEEALLSAQAGHADISLLGYDRSVVAIAMDKNTDTEAEDAEGEPDTEPLKDTLTATNARFGILLTEEDFEPDNWDFYELVDNTTLEARERSEFEQSVVIQLSEAGCPVVQGQELTESEWTDYSENYPDLQTERFWKIKEVFDTECPLIEGQEFSEADYQEACNDYPAHLVEAGRQLTAEEREALSKTSRDLKTESTWHITAVFDPKCALSVGEYASDADYQKARKACSLSFSDINVTNAEAKEHIQRVEEMAQGRITAYTDEKEQALQQLEMGDELKPGVIKRVKVYVASKRPISIGDKMAGRYGNKGVVAKILPAEDMPYLPDGTPVELVLNPLGVPSRMNVGQILEIHLGWACHELGIRVASPVFDGATEQEVFDKLGETDLPERSKRTGKSILFDGRTGEPFAQEVTVGYVYFLKLNHLVADKMHARSTGPYSLVTQQPLGGKAQHGGQRLGEMEVWALEAYGAAHTLQEMLTLKSDDVLGRREIYESVVKGLNPDPPGTPESFKVLVRELQTLGLHVSLDQDEE
ncbi:MAG: DNA-directed RNA polymerase subunit beta [Candidatus Poribacteria bacterium]|nr:DNA-directed RNA polymerase subunit beta [Candidatus Poribacteria bacterium]